MDVKPNSSVIGVRSAALESESRPNAPNRTLKLNFLRTCCSPKQTMRSRTWSVFTVSIRLPAGSCVLHDKLRPATRVLRHHGGAHRGAQGVASTLTQATGIVFACGFVSTGLGIWTSSTPSVSVALICSGVTPNLAQTLRRSRAARNRRLRLGMNLLVSRRSGRAAPGSTSEIALARSWCGARMLRACAYRRRARWKCRRTSIRRRS